MSDPDGSNQLQPGASITPHHWPTISSGEVNVPDGSQIVHLQLRRFAGCPICNLHLRSVVSRNDELVAAGVREVVVFHSSTEDLRKYESELPFAVIADPEKKIYAEFGVESSPRAVLSPRAWPAIARGLFHDIGAAIRRRQPPPPPKPDGGSLGLPGDFLVDRDGRLIASKYGEHAYDQWSVDEVLALVAEREPTAAGSSPTPAHS
jgi:peroxiredoxin